MRHKDAVSVDTVGSYSAPTHVISDTSASARSRSVGVPARRRANVDGSPSPTIVTTRGNVSPDVQRARQERRLPRGQRGLEAKRSTHRRRRRSLRESRSRRESQHGIILQYALSAARHHLPGPARRVARPAHQSLAAQLQIRTACDGAWTSPGRGPRASGSTIRQGSRHGWSWRTGVGRWSRIDPGQRLDQRSTLDAKVAAHGCLRHAIVQRSKNGIELLADYHRRSPPPGRDPAADAITRAARCARSVVLEQVP